MLLVILRETNGTEEVHRTQKQFSNWYGISERSAATGIKQLRDVGLLAERIETEKEPLSKTGWTARHHYSLTGDFAFRARESQRKQARRAIKSRETATSGTPKPVEKLKKPRRKPKAPPAT